MVKFLGVIGAFVLMAGVWLGACGVLLIALWVAQNLWPNFAGIGTPDPMNWHLSLGLVAIGAVSVGLVQLFERYFPDDKLPPNKDFHYPPN